MRNEMIKAKPLILVPLDTQIRELGGRGYNCSVSVTPVLGTYSCVFTFDTPEGEKQLLTQNILNLGMIECNYILHNGDTGEFLLASVKKVTRAPYKLCYQKVLGTNIEEMMWALKLIWPNRHSWNLNIPERLLNNASAFSHARMSA